MGNVSKHGHRFWHDMVNHGLQKGLRMAFFPDALFLQLPQDLLTFSHMGSHSERPKKALFHQRSYSESPGRASGKVFTNETPCMFQNIEMRCVLMTHELGLGPNKTAEVVLSVIVQHS